MINWKTVCNVIGSLLLIESLLFAVCQGVAWAYDEHNLLIFTLPFVVALGSGLALKWLGLHSESRLNRRDTYLILSGTWVIFTLFGMLPFLLSGATDNITDAFFETMSGFTTTGASILDSIDALPRAVLFWRSLTHWLGGLGIVFFTLAILPSVGMSDVKLFSAETTGFKLGKLHPRFSIAAKWLWSIYLLLTVACTISLYLCGMDLFDSINHAFSTMASGGFSTRQDSIMAFNSPAIEYVLAGFMLLVGINFALLYLFIIKRSFSVVLHDGELHTYLLCVGVITLSVALVLIWGQGYDIETALRHSFFQVVSMQTSTGYIATDYMLWPRFTWILIFIAMFVGGCAGSTAGGYKCIRVLTAYKFATNELKKQLHPRAVLPLRFGRTEVSKEVTNTFIAFTFFYVVLLSGGTISFIALGLPYLDSFGLSLSSLSNVGPTIGYTFGATDSWSTLPTFGKWVSSFLMLAGRLEIFSLLLPFYPHFWQKN